MADIELVERHNSWGGVQYVYRHASVSTQTPMTFAVFVPPQSGPRPVVTFLAGLTGTPYTAMEKGEYRRAAAQLGLIIVLPDTSPRGEGVPDDTAFDLGQGAGFYLNATQAPYDRHYRMCDYVTRELPAIIAEHFDVDPERQGIMGHSMGGHGALVIGLSLPQTYRSVSALAPIVAPGQVPWGQKAFAAYLGEDRAAWRQYDSISLIEDGKRTTELFVDIGTDDMFYERELKPELLEAACAAAGLPLTLRRLEGYDHSYFYVSSVMADHLKWHADRLK